jgi:hypothetical protein
MIGDERDRNDPIAVEVRGIDRLLCARCSHEADAMACGNHSTMQSDKKVGLSD